MSVDNYIGEELELFKLAKNWKKYWVSKISPLLGDSVLEVGAGIGSNLILLNKDDRDWLALEPDAHQANQIEETIKDDQGYVKTTVEAKTTQEIDANKKFDTIIYIDVLEHIEKDKEEMECVYKLLHQGGSVVVLSPAHQFLYSPFDKAVGHFRRYNKKTMLEIVPEGAEVESLYYLDSVGCIASWINSKLLKQSMPTKGQIDFWDTIIVPISVILDKLLRFKVGKTAVMVIKKPY